ncbi:MAG: hypothetical protein WC117_00040 [Sphaerochaetaceae bacterium]
MRDDALKLFDNRLFKKVILENFCVTEAARYVQASADPALDAAQRADALNLAQASGHLKRYLSVLVQMGNAAATNLRDSEQALDEMRAEEGNE